MPEERSAGLLVSPMGHAEAISKEEHAKLDLCRQILNEDTGLNAAFKWFLNLVAAQPKERAMDDAAVVKWVVAHYIMDNADESAGLLITRNLDIREGDMLSESELTALNHTLITLRMGGWFSAWLKVQVGTIADGVDGQPDDRYPSPLKIAGTLGLDIVEWQDRVEAAKELAEMRPDLLFPAPPAVPEAAAEPSTARTPPKPRRARKRARKAA